MKHRNATMPPIQYRGYPLPAIHGEGIMSMGRAANFVAGKMGVYMPMGMCLEVYRFIRYQSVNASSAVLYARLEPWGA